MRTVDYLDALNVRYSATDYRVAKMLGKSTASTSQYRKKGVTFDDATAIRVAELLELDPLEVIADMHAERAKDERVREVWTRLASSFHHAASVAGVAVISSAGVAAAVAQGALFSPHLGAWRFLASLGQSILCQMRAPMVRQLPAPVA